MVRCSVQAKDTIWKIFVHMITCQSTVPLGTSLKKVRPYTAAGASQHSTCYAIAYWCQSCSCTRAKISTEATAQLQAIARHP